MTKPILLRSFAAMLFLASAVYSQSPQTTPTPQEVIAGSGSAPVAWQQYSSSADNFSAAFPKLPVVLRSGWGCTTIAHVKFYAYAEDVAYELSVTSRSKTDAPRSCTTVEPYRNELFSQRATELGASMKPADLTFAVNGRKAVFQSDSETRVLIGDLKNDRWFELAIHHRPGIEVDPERFMRGLSLVSDSGLEIGEGAAVTLGDQPAANTSPAVANSTVTAPPGKLTDTADGGKAVSAADSVSGLTIIAKPRPSYTDEARTNGVQGTVQLRVTFNANGSVGSVAAVSSLPSGLTEQAIKAVRKMVFLPKKVQGFPVSVTKVVEYSFSIY